MAILNGACASRLSAPCLWPARKCWGGCVLGRSLYGFPYSGLPLERKRSQSPYSTSATILGALELELNEGREGTV